MSRNLLRLQRRGGAAGGSHHGLDACKQDLRSKEPVEQRPRLIVAADAALNWTVNTQPPVSQQLHQQHNMQPKL